MLVLRRAEPSAGLLWLHTDVRSAKRAELAADPRAALTFWDARANLQLRVEGVAQIDPDPGLLSDAWARVPEAARRNYASVAAPGAPLAGALAFLEDGRANFAMIAVRAERLEWLWLGPVHRRGESRRREDGWASRALVP